MALKLTSERAPPFRAADDEFMEGLAQTIVATITYDGPGLAMHDPAHLPGAWNPLVSAPQNRPVYMTADPERDADGTLVYWRTTREKHQGIKGWRPHSFWASVLTKRALEFEPAWWREPDTSAAA